MITRRHHSYGSRYINYFDNVSHLHWIRKLTNALLPIPIFSLRQHAIPLSRFLEESEKKKKARHMRLIAIRALAPIKLPSTALSLRLSRQLSVPSAMASLNKEASVEIKKSDNKETKPGVSKKALEPPEKPLPGDCCGSGCVRCVWDVYYEELEAYNKSLASFNSDADSKTSNS
jgi:Oxidoreductase-like protein, N-terminal